MGEPKYRRRVPTVHQILEMLLLQGAVIRCYRTKKRITIKNFRDTQREHVIELGLFADSADKAAHDTPDNWRMSFSEAHSIITNGTKATSAGSSKARIAKAKRHEKERLAAVDVRIPDDASLIYAHPLLRRSMTGAKPKLRGQGFRKDPTRVRGVDGKVRNRKPRLDRG